MTKEEAQTQGKKLAKLLGKCWKPVIWENIDWCYQVVYTGTGLSVLPSVNGYTAFLSTDKKRPIGGRWYATAVDPRDAVELVIRDAEAELELIKRTVIDSSAALAGFKRKVIWN